MSNRERPGPYNDRIPVHIRREIESSEDPYIQDEQLPENSVCKSCGYVFTSGRWYTPEQLRDKADYHPSGDKNMVVCPACRKMRDRLPGGVLRLKGTFVWHHRDEVLSLIRNESEKALNINPLERIMSMETVDGGEIEITTTNEKLAQRIGKALHRAYSGDIEYKWSEDNKLARINWHRDV